MVDTELKLPLHASHSLETRLAEWIGHPLIKLDPVIVCYDKRIQPSDTYTDVCLFISHAGMAYTYSYYYPRWFTRNDDVWVGYLAVDMK